MGQPNRLHDLFTDAVEMPAADRGAYLRAACDGDAALRAAVDDLLAAHARAGRFLSDPGVSADAADDRLRQVGPYRLTRVIGRGGYGVVYTAEQDEPLRRTVAVKVLRAGRDTRLTLARFDLERAALARMSHPNIARVFDAGTTPDGRPYVVMEWVDGRPITDHCRQNKLPVGDRLSIFRDVCAAVQHAHQKGIIHRDLKPSNVLVEVVDGRPVAKVIDFGIAKAVGADAVGAAGIGAGGAGLTRDDQLLGTPQYMSPEQVAADPADVDTRADVYGLGTVLYELLADRPPFDADTLRSAAAAEVRRVVTEVDPPPPSRTGPGHTRRVARELDWVVGRAIEKDRTRRYPTAQALSADVFRFMVDEPVEAGPPTARYRVGKAVRRHRRMAATAAAVVLALAAGTTTATVGLVRARAARDRARAAERREADDRRAAEAARDRAVAAERREADARRVAEANAARVFSAQQFVYDLVVPPLGEAPAVPVEFLDLLARRAHDGLVAEHPEVLSTLHLALGTAYHRANLTDREIVQLQEYLLMQPSPLPDAQHNWAALENLGAAYRVERNDARAEPLFRRGLEMYRRMHDGVDGIGDAPMLERVGVTTADPDEAEQLLRSAADLYRAHDRPPSRRLGVALGELAGVRRSKGDVAGAALLSAEADALLKRPPAAAATQP